MQKAGPLNSAVGALFRHSSLVSPEPCLKHLVISTALFLSYTRSRALVQQPMGQMGSVPAFPLAADWFPCPHYQKAPHRTPQISTAVSARRLHRAQEDRSQHGAVIAGASAEMLAESQVLV